MVQDSRALPLGFQHCQASSYTGGYPDELGDCPQLAVVDIRLHSGDGPEACSGVMVMFDVPTHSCRKNKIAA